MVSVRRPPRTSLAYSRFQSASGYLPLLRIVSPMRADRCPTDQDGKAAAAPLNPRIIDGVQSRVDMISRGAGAKIGLHFTCA